MDNVKPHTVTPHYALPLKYPHLWDKAEVAETSGDEETSTSHLDQEQNTPQNLGVEESGKGQGEKQGTTPSSQSTSPSSTSKTQTSSPSTESTNPTTPPQSRSPSPTPKTRETVYSGLGLAPTSLGCPSIYDKSKKSEGSVESVEMSVPTPSQLLNRNVRKRWGRYRWYA